MRNFKNPKRGMAITALAGPVSNLLAALAAALIRNIILCTDCGVKAYIANEVTPLWGALVILEYLVSVNVGLAIFNLIPVPPLDGFNVLRYFTSEKFDRWFYQHQREVSIGFFAFIIVLNQIPSNLNPLIFLSTKISNLIWLAVEWIPKARWGI